MMYRCKYFTLRELVNPGFLGTSESILWRLFDERLLKLADKIREKYGPCTINANGLVDCGLRKMDSKTGARYSAHCFDTDTEVLTLNGWKRYDEISVGENILSFNMKTGAIETDNINNIIIQKYTGNMVVLKNKLVDICVTDRHELVLKKQNGQYIKKTDKVFDSEYIKQKKEPYKKEFAIDVLGKRKRIVCCGKKQDGENNIDLLDLLVCAFVCDGWYASRGVIEFNFIKERKIKRVREIVKAMGLKCKEHAIIRKGGVGVCFRISDKNTVSKIRDLCGETKNIPLAWLRRHGEAIKTLVKELVFYDGHVDERPGCKSFLFVTTNKHNADMISAMGSVAGLRTCVAIRPPVNERCKKQFIVNFADSLVVRHDIKTSKNIEYIESVDNKTVWCINTNNHTLIVRRNGKICVSGNCFGRALDLHIRSIELEAAKITDATARKKWKRDAYNKVREELMVNHEFDLLSFENNISWLHISVENRDNRLFNP